LILARPARDISDASATRSLEVLSTGRLQLVLLIARRLLLFGARRLDVFGPFRVRGRGREHQPCHVVAL